MSANHDLNEYFKHLEDTIRQLETRNAYLQGKIDGFKLSKWISCDRRLPLIEGKYLVCYKTGLVDVARFCNGEFREYDTVLPIAWQELPKPYRKDVE